MSSQFQRNLFSAQNSTPNLITNKGITKTVLDMTQKVYFPHILSKELISGYTPVKLWHKISTLEDQDPKNRDYNIEEWRQALGRQLCRLGEQENPIRPSHSQDSEPLELSEVEGTSRELLGSDFQLFSPFGKHRRWYLYSILDKQSARGRRRLAWSSGRLRTTLSGEGYHFLAVPTLLRNRAEHTLFLQQSRGQPWLFRHRHGEQAVFSWLSETESIPPSFSQHQCILLQPIIQGLFFFLSQENNNVTLKALGPTREKSDYLVDKSQND